ncbi:MAG: glycosyl transferase [Lachnospiraceae bacterium]|nr:glycosyl transferase [Lachnospiraceae bacterium]
MIGTRLTKGQGLGNQLFCYITTRCIAEDKGYDFAILGADTLANNMHSDCGLYFMDLDPGVPAAESDFTSEYHEREDRLYVGNSVHDVEHGVYVTGRDDKMADPVDNTLLLGNMQDESYFISHKSQIREWLKVKPEYDCMDYCDDDLCIIHMRCTDYMNCPELLLSRRYWKQGIRHMRTINPDMRFMIITNDVKAASRFLPGIPAYNFDLAKDYSIIKNAKYLLLANSSFTFFPAFTSERNEYILAPKFWARHNVSDGYWASEQNIYTGFHYMDRRGRVFTPEECREELKVYKSRSKLYSRLGVKPKGFARTFQLIRAKRIYAVFYLGRIMRALQRRLKIGEAGKVK